MAEAVFRFLTTSNPTFLKVDSAGIAVTIRQEPDFRTVEMLQRNGIVGYNHRARAFQREDFVEFDYILAMDRTILNFLQMQKMKPFIWGDIRRPK